MLFLPLLLMTLLGSKVCRVGLFKKRKREKKGGFNYAEPFQLCEERWRLFENGPNRGQCMILWPWTQISGLSLCSGRSSTIFQDIEEIQENVVKQLLANPKTGAPGMLPSMERMLHKMWRFRTEFLWRRIINAELTGCSFLFIAPVLIRFFTLIFFSLCNV